VDVHLELRQLVKCLFDYSGSVYQFEYECGIHLVKCLMSPALVASQYIPGTDQPGPTVSVFYIVLVIYNKIYWHNVIPMLFVYFILVQECRWMSIVH